MAKGNYKRQNIILLFSSYFFYGCWDYRFLFLLIFSTSLDFFTGIKMHEATNQRSRKMWFWLSVFINLGFLSIFKYYNFFVSSFADGLSELGIKSSFYTLQVILPVGISFYTFHGLSYVIDIYKGRIKPERNIIDYSVFVCFFPLLVAGPIERATHLLPQLIKKREFDYAKAIDGMQQILWGVFKKIVVGDNCATIVNNVFNSYQTQSGSMLLLGGVFFAFQIYGDFSGYSDIAIGVSRLFGISLIRNFNFPYFSRDIAEFWRRWHISLTTWFRDYLYIPLGGSRGTKWQVVRNTFIIFLVSGFWHGANWTFIAWGAFHAMLFLPLILLGQNRKNTNTVAEGRILPNMKEFIQMSFTFLFVVVGWIIFRADTIGQATDYLGRMISINSDFFDVSFLTTSGSLSGYNVLISVVSILLMTGVEWWHRDNQYGLEISHLPGGLKWVTCVSLCLLIYVCHADPTAFIYFQF
jgi:D-alanyl-lipoteichoic acid acyltransferase DltB (MBOAT superfamily)